MKKTLICILLMVIFFTNMRVYAASPPSVVAEGALLVDVDSGKTIYEKNIHTVFYPASTTKIMTALLVLENCKLDDKVIIGENPSSFIDGNKIYLYKDEEFTVEQLLYALMVESANDVAIALAEHVSGSEEAFVKLMNEKANQIGSFNTNFVNPHGLFDKNHFTTAYDISLIAREAMKNEEFRKIVGTKSYVVEPTNKQPEKRYLHTYNRLLVNPEYHIDGINGVKTGYTSESGHSFVGSVYREDMKLMVVLLRGKKPGLWEDALSLLNYGFESYRTIKHVSAGEYITSLQLSTTDIKIPLVAESTLYYTYPADNIPVIESDIKIINDYTGDISEGQKIGIVNYSVNGTKIGSINLLADGSLQATALYTYQSTSNGSAKKVYSSWLFISSICLLALIPIVSIFKMLKKKRSST